MKNNKAPGADGAEFDIIKESDYKSYKHIAKMLTNCFSTWKIPQNWNNNEVIILLHKKGNLKISITTDQ
jgi:hypothetical protein